ncbi:DtxR family iron (metal) dependent repressor [Homoserinimonas aerilata]|uniref:Manganese transport regulator n=1 Tax=Homoserinimonas aerilata TaxID=1162970 RepID=A0A542YH97_9MICO|nr:metal-dependent transcriptional regulator [Homoserinimonas aerilata]TQL47473.1 DtxR family iron (metal) dependent repressor [Homoserinimonas aerilata]
MKKPGAPTSVVEDYVKVIYAHTEWQPVPVTPSVLAAKLGLAASTVTEMVKKLAVAGLVTHVPYGAVTLTEEGRMLALRMVRRHRLIETWLVSSFGYGWDEVHDEAEVLEHSLSDRLLEAIAEQLGQPSRDPHGDPIPSADGTVQRPDAVLLSEAPDGFEGRIARISDSDPMLLRYLTAEAVELDAPIAVVGRRPFGGALTVRVGATEHDLGDAAAASVWVSPL